MGMRAPQAQVKRELNRLAKKYAGVEFRVIYASNGETAIVGVNPVTGELQLGGYRAFQVKYLWNRMCQHDKISPDSKFVAFSDSNPFHREYNEAMALLQEGK